MKQRAAVLVLLVTVLGLSTAAPVAAQPLTTPLVIPPTTIPGTDITVSGTLDAKVLRFSARDGDITAVAKASGTLTLVSPTLGTATVNISKARITLMADVEADCQGHLDIDFRGVFQLKATVTFSSITLTINETVPISGSLAFTAQTAEQTALVCDVSQLLQTNASLSDILAKLEALLQTL
ncbi:MAG: hypothetical protein K0R20_2448 [Actinomycetia bacterium]|jgi:hypothetical protein|nr:hypothetical protein [Actinomycetes bacterium]